MITIEFGAAIAVVTVGAVLLMWRFDRHLKATRQPFIDACRAVQAGADPYFEDAHRALLAAADDGEPT